MALSGTGPENNGKLPKLTAVGPRGGSYFADIAKKHRPMEPVAISGSRTSPNPTKGVFPNAFAKDFENIVGEGSPTTCPGPYFAKAGEAAKVGEPQSKTD